MARGRFYKGYGVPQSVARTVCAICADYYRRADLLRRGAVDGTVYDEYLRLNSAIESAISDIEPGIRKYMLRDLCEARGYERSGARDMISKVAYYARRKKLIVDIAVALGLIGERKDGK